MTLLLLLVVVMSTCIMVMIMSSCRCGTCHVHVDVYVHVSGGKGRTSGKVCGASRKNTLTPRVKWTRHSSTLARLEKSVRAFVFLGVRHA
jgi:hypothetical protein